jgi:hypothetical protein
MFQYLLYEELNHRTLNDLLEGYYWESTRASKGVIYL